MFYRVFFYEFGYLVIQWIRATHVDEKKKPGWLPGDIREPVSMRVNTNDEQTPHFGIFLLLSYSCMFYIHCFCSVMKTVDKFDQAREIKVLSEFISSL